MADLDEIVRRIVRAERDARRILATHESSKTRVITVEDTYARLGKLSLRQDDLFWQALRSIENSLYRSAIIMAWAAFMDFVEEKVAEDGFSALNAKYPNWKITDIDDLRDSTNDYQIIEALRKVELVTKSEMKSLHGFLSIRNESAHPSGFFPDINEALGFVANLLQRIERIRPKKAKP